MTTKHSSYVIHDEFKRDLKAAAALLGLTSSKVIELLIAEYLPVTIDGVPRWPDETIRKRLVQVAKEWNE